MEALAAVMIEWDSPGKMRVESAAMDRAGGMKGEGEGEEGFQHSNLILASLATQSYTPAMNTMDTRAPYPALTRVPRGIGPLAPPGPPRAVRAPLRPSAARAAQPDKVHLVGQARPVQPVHVVPL